MRLAIEAQSLQVAAGHVVDLSVLPDFRLLQSLIADACENEIVLAFSQIDVLAADRIRRSLLRVNPRLLTICPALPWEAGQRPAPGSPKTYCQREIWSAAIEALRPDAVLVLSPHTASGAKHAYHPAKSPGGPVLACTVNDGSRLPVLGDRARRPDSDQEGQEKEVVDRAELWLLGPTSAAESFAPTSRQAIPAQTETPRLVAAKDGEEWVTVFWRELGQAVNKKRQSPRFFSLRKPRPALAYFSPMPPEATGIADYSAALIADLSAHYRVTVVTPQRPAQGQWVAAVEDVRDPGWLKQNCGRFERVLYQLGNSHYHLPMLDTMSSVPGVIALHDVTLSSLYQCRDALPEGRGTLARALYHSHGWNALVDQHSRMNRADLLNRYSCNLRVVQDAIGTIVHSGHARELLLTAFGPEYADHCWQIPLVRSKPAILEKRIARERLGVDAEAFLVCSFGRIGQNKLSRRVLSAWVGSALASDAACQLVFVGEAGGGKYGEAFLEEMARAERSARVRCTGRVAPEDYCAWLCAADLAVQLRGGDGGETSGPALDCLNYGVPVVANVHGAMRELPADAALMLPENFIDEHLSRALAKLRAETDLRQSMAQAGRRSIDEGHRSALCAGAIAQAIEAAYAAPSRAEANLVQRVAAVAGELSAPERRQFAIAVSRAVPPWPRKPEILFDVSGLLRNDLRTGVERVTRELLFHCLRSSAQTHRVEAVYAMPDEEGYRYARQFVAHGLGLEPRLLADDWVEPAPGDSLLITHMHHGVIERQRALLEQWSRAGVRRYAMVYDLLPVLMPQHFVPGHDSSHRQWLELVRAGHAAVCISRCVADELRRYFLMEAESQESPRICVIPMGGDLGSMETGVSGKAIELVVRRALTERASCLMVGTIEPRKGYLQVVEAFSQLWAKGVDLNLVIVGREGWKAVERAQREPVARIVKRIREHPEFSKRLLWLSDLDDNSLREIYLESGCLLAASEGEGFGLPILEAMQAGLPVIARDIPVFREATAGQGDFFPDLQDPHAIRDAILRWHDRVRTDGVKRRPAPVRAAWENAAGELLRVLTGSSQANPQWGQPAIRS